MATKSTIKPADMDTLAIAEDICAGNPALVEYINSTEENYKPVRAQVLRLTSKLSNKYADGSFVPNKVIHRLVWDIINVATGEEDTDISITI